MVLVGNASTKPTPMPDVYSGARSLRITALRRAMNSVVPARSSTASPPEDMPLVKAPGAEKSTFLSSQWAPFVQEMKDALLATRTRHAVGVSLEEMLPPQAQWVAWAERCAELTSRWHGRPNISAVFQLLVECSEYDGVSPYRFDAMPREWSHDG
jgi:hypothetical protein